MKKLFKRFAGTPQKQPSSFGTPIASDAGVFLVLALSLMAAAASVFSPAVLGLENWNDGIEGVLTHGLVVLNGG